jgi:hypothetical protein
MIHSLLSCKLLELALNSLDTLSGVRIKASLLTSLLIKTLSIPKPKPNLLGASSSVVNTFLIKITSFSFNYIVVIIVCIAFESSVINLI